MTALLWAACAWAQGSTEPRVALIIGNNAYASAPLHNPVNDARAMARALETTGFSVILKTDATQPELTAALREFGNRLAGGGPGTVGLFYFAGHGMQIKGRNFLIPVGANIEHEDEVSYQALDAQAVMDKMESAGNGTNIVILDACRNNPFVRSFRSGRQGLAQMDAPVGTLVAFSTAPGSIASDGQGGNGLYTAHLLTAIKQPGQKVEDVFKQVRSAVLRDSNKRQVPWEASSLVGDFYFVPPAPGATIAAAAALAAPNAGPDLQTAIDEALWSAIKDSTSSAELFAYLNRFPLGLHAREARARLNDMVAPAALVSAATATRPPNVPALIDVDALLREAEVTERERQATLVTNQQRLDEIVRWGDTGTDLRPAQPQRNGYGFAQGDRWRWRSLDQVSDRYGPTHLWRIDRIQADGSLWINGGAQRLDARGQQQGGNDELNGLWIEWLPPLPVAEIAAAPGSEARQVTTHVQIRDAEGVITKASLSGVLKAGAVEEVATPAGKLSARRVEAYLRGPAARSDGRQFSFTFKLAWWLAPGVGLPVVYEIEERVDDRLARRVRHELTAYDVLGAAPALANQTK
jgi:uncharacterized caspase-like protein